MKPWLTSVGIGFPVFGLWGHWYIETRKKHKLTDRSFLGVKFVVVSYRRIDSVEDHNS